MALKRWLPWLLLAVSTSCVHKPVTSYRFSGCKVLDKWTDAKGVEYRNCDCNKGKEIGFDAKTGARIIKCDNE